MSEWKEKTLGELSIRVSSGLTPLKSNENFWENPSIPWLKTDQLGEKYIFDTNTKISKEALAQTSLRIYPENTISIAMYGEGKTRGNLSIIKAPMATNQACCNIEIDPKLADVEYVCYYLKTQYDSLRKLSSGVRKNLNSNDIKNYKIYIPESVSVQKSIVRILTLLDNKISLNNQINQELETMAKALYDYWFVQFDFPDQNGKPYKSSGGKMVYHPELKREIPEGWGVDSLWNIANFYNGLAMQKYRPDTNEDDYLPVIKIREMMNGFSKDSEKARLDIPTEAVVESGDILFSWSATLEVIIWGKERGALNQHIFKVLPISKFDLWALELIIQSQIHYFQMIAAGKATTMGHIKRADLDKTVEVPTSIPDKLNMLGNTLWMLATQAEQENQTLARTRDELLPLLMSGKITVRDAEEASAEVGVDKHEVEE